MDIGKIHLQWFGGLDKASGYTGNTGLEKASGYTGNIGLEKASGYTGNTGGAKAGGGAAGSGSNLTPVATFNGKDGKIYSTQAEKDAADAAFDQAAAKTKADADAAAAADKLARTGKDGVVYDTPGAKAAADRVFDDTTAIGGVKEAAVDPLATVTKKSDADILATAQGLSQTAQGGAVASATEAAKSSGLSPAQAALLGSKAGATTYQDTLGSNVSTQGQLAEQQYGTEKSAAQEKYSTDVTAATTQYTAELQAKMSKYAADASALTGKTGQDLQKYISDQGNALALAMQKAGLDAEKAKYQMDQLGFIEQAGSWVLKAVLGLAKGTDYASGGAHLVGEEGPEMVILPEGAKVIPANKTAAILDPHDGYAALARVLDGLNIKEQKPAEAPPDKPKKSLGEQVDEYMAYIKGAK